MNSNKKPHLFIDFDGVLFNTRVFKKDFFRIISFSGVKPREVRRLYDKVCVEEGRYDLRKHLKLLRRLRPQFNTGRTLENIYEFLGTGRKYVYPDALYFLRLARKLGFRSELVSGGVRAFQGKKIIGSGLAKFFDRVHVSKNMYKAKTVRKLVGRKKAGFIFIDDRKDAVEEMKKMFPKSFVVQVLRSTQSKGFKSSRVDFVAKNLREASKKLKTLANYA